MIFQILAKCDDFSRKIINFCQILKNYFCENFLGLKSIKNHHFLLNFEKKSSILVKISKILWHFNNLFGKLVFFIKQSWIGYQKVDFKRIVQYSEVNRKKQGFLSRFSNITTFWQTSLRKKNQKICQKLIQSLCFQLAFLHFFMALPKTFNLVFWYPNHH